MIEKEFDLERAKAICEHCCAPFSEVTDEQVSIAMQQFYLALVDIERQAHRIAELEDMVCEANAISIHNFMRYEVAISEGHITGFDHRTCWSDMPEDRRNAIIEVHRAMLKCVGKL